jgi:putative oxidoreductase
MNALLPLGRWFFAIPLALFGVLHFMAGSSMEGVVPEYLPGRTFFVYFTGACLVAAAVSFVTHKYDKLAAVLLAIFMLCMILMVQLPAFLGGKQEALFQILKDLMIVGAALMYARHYATDRSIIG